MSDKYLQIFLPILRGNARFCILRAGERREIITVQCWPDKTSGFFHACLWTTGGSSAASDRRGCSAGLLGVTSAKGADACMGDLLPALMR